MSESQPDIERAPQGAADPKLTRPMHPKQAMAGTNTIVRYIVMGVIAVIGIGFVVNMKSNAKRVDAEQAVIKAAAKEQREAKNADIIKQLAASYKGESTNAQQLALVAKVGQAIATKSDAKNRPQPLKFHLLAEPNAINLFALSSGDVYITTALLNRMQTEGQLAAVLAHGAAHVIAEDGLSEVPPPQGVALAQPNWQYSAAQERSADVIGLRLMAQAGYDPGATIGMYDVLLKGYQSGADVSYFSTHPNEPDRLEKVSAAITTLYPQGIPKELSK